jgi:hypothetical protein
LKLDPSTYSLKNSSVGVAAEAGWAATKGVTPTASAAVVTAATLRRTGRE